MAVPHWQLEVLESNSTAVNCDTGWMEAQKTFPRENPSGRKKKKKLKKKKEREKQGGGKKASTTEIQ